MPVIIRWNQKSIILKTMHVVHETKKLRLRGREHIHQTCLIGTVSLKSCIYQSMPLSGVDFCRTVSMVRSSHRVGLMVLCSKHLTPVWRCKYDTFPFHWSGLSYAWNLRLKRVQHSHRGTHYSRRMMMHAITVSSWGEVCDFLKPLLPTWDLGPISQREWLYASHDYEYWHNIWLDSACSLTWLLVRGT